MRISYEHESEEYSEVISSHHFHNIFITYLQVRNKIFNQKRELG